MPLKMIVESSGHAGLEVDDWYFEESSSVMERFWAGRWKGIF